MEHLFDPVAKASTKCMKCSNVLEKVTAGGVSNRERDLRSGQLHGAITGLEISLGVGEDHPYVRVLSRKVQAASLQPANKKRTERPS